MSWKRLPPEKEIKKRIKGKEIILEATEKLQRHKDILHKFMTEVLHIKGYLVTDRTLLSDFEVMGNPEGFEEMICRGAQKAFGVDISDRESDYLVDVLALIKARAASSRG